MNFHFKFSCFFSYHTGSVALGSSFLSPFYQIAVIFCCGDENSDQSSNSEQSYFAKFSNKLYLLFMPFIFIDYTYTMTALSGKDIWDSMNKVYSIILQNPGKYLALNMVSYP